MSQDSAISDLSTECNCKKYCACVLNAKKGHGKRSSQKSRKSDESIETGRKSEGSRKSDKSKESESGASLAAQEPSDVSKETERKSVSGKSKSSKSESGKSNRKSGVSDSIKSSKKYDSKLSKSQLGSIAEEIGSVESSIFHYVDSKGEVHSRTASTVLQKLQDKMSVETFSSSSSEDSAVPVRSSFFESSFSMFGDFVRTKEFLQKGTEISLYDHLSDVIQKVVSNRIGDAVDYIESISKDVKEQRFLSRADKLRDVYEKPKNICEVKRMNSMYKSFHAVEDGPMADDFLDEEHLSVMGEIISDEKKSDTPQVPNFIESNFYFRQAGFGLPEWEIYDLTMSVVRLLKKMTDVFSKIRFFGKIFGVHKTYYVLETEFTLEEIERCKQIQLEQEQARLAQEKDVEDSEVTVIIDGEIRTITLSDIPEEELAEISHNELIRRLVDKSDKAKLEEMARKSEHTSQGSRSVSQKTGSVAISSGSQASKKTGSIRTGGSQGTDGASRKTDGSSVKTESESTKEGLSSASNDSPTSSFLLRLAEENELMVKDIIFEVIRGILECVAMEFVRQIEEEMPILPPEPQINWKPPKEVPAEEIGEGLNKTVFWVCHNLEDDWVCLPNVNPKHIDIARKISLGFTGNLDHEIISYPPFDGKEREYLRAQLARINSATSISPKGYYVKGEDDEDETGDAGGSRYGEGEEYDENYDYEDEGIEIRRNPNYKARSLTQLADYSMFHWVHHRKEIKKDGRITWWEYDEEEQVEVDVMDEDGEETEHTMVSGSSMSRMPRPLFKPLSKEESWAHITSNVGWSASKHFSYIAGPHIVALKSLRWPGAVAYANVDGKTDHMYIGWGLKYLPNGYRPIELPPFSKEYPTGEDIIEQMDPSVTDEEDQLEEGMPPLRPKKELSKSTEIESDGEEGEGSVGEEEEGEEGEGSNSSSSSNSE